MINSDDNNRSMDSRGKRKERRKKERKAWAKKKETVGKKEGALEAVFLPRQLRGFYK